jgi:hypothetical protein
MDVLQTVVANLTKEEVRGFKLWLNSTNSSEQRKDILLLDYIRKANNYNEDYIFGKLYEGNDKNSFYKLKHRLLEDLGNYLAMTYTGKSDANNIYWYLSLQQIFTQRSQPKVAHYYLLKAEKKGLAVEHYELLDIVYSVLIKLSGELSEIDPEIYISKQKANAILLNKMRETDQVLAAMAYRLKATQNFGSRDSNLTRLLNNTIRDFAKDETIKKSKAFQTKIYRLVSQVLIQRHDFEELERFMVTTYSKFEHEKWFDKSNHDTKLQMLVYLVNALFKNKKHTESLDYAETLGEEMEAYGQLLYEKYLFFYYNALVINYAQIDIVRGLKALDEMEREIKGKKNAYFDFFVLLNKASLQFFKKNYNEAVRNIVRLYVNDHYKKTDSSFKLKIAVAECIMQLEASDYSYVKKRIEQVRKDYATLLSLSDYKREKQLLDIIAEISSASSESDLKYINKKIEKFVRTEVKQEVEDGEILKYRNWLATRYKIGL